MTRGNFGEEEPIVSMETLCELCKNGLQWCENAARYRYTDTQTGVCGHYTFRLGMPHAKCNKKNIMF